jgi:hypothetical protein
MLTTIEVDGNNQSLPIAFAFINSENIERCYWFLERVKHAVTVNVEGVCMSVSYTTIMLDF